jgi:catechol 2,3-dioxygenase-like lactoylglutathione lyase family enzyme
VKIEHVAFQVGDPVALAKWYVEHLGMTIKRSQAIVPFVHFLAADGDAVMLEFYANPKIPVPDYQAVDPLTVHIAFTVGDVMTERARLIAAGATPAGDLQTNDAGDSFAMIRDPWGIPLQLMRRRDRMI